MPDFLFCYHGSICTLSPMTPAAKQWRADHLPDDAMQWGADGVVIEPRYAADILQGIEADGLTVKL